MYYFILIFYLIISIPFIIKNLNEWKFNKIDNKAKEKLEILKNTKGNFYNNFMIVIYIFVVIFTILLLPFEIINYGYEFIVKKRGKVYE